MIWYKIKPVDTLFFRGGETMNMGIDHGASSLFPPPISVLYGALRTTILKQNEISFEEYYTGRIPNDLLMLVGKPEDAKPGFSLIGPIFAKNDDFFIPAPYMWYKEKSRESEEKMDQHIKVYVSRSIDYEGIKGNKPIRWVKTGEGDPESLGGKWMKVSDLYSTSHTENIPIFSSSDFYMHETHTGIARDKAGRVRKGHLYSFDHIRLVDDVALLIGIDTRLPIESSGIIFIGAEKRFASYKEVDGPEFRDTATGLYLSLSPIEAHAETNNTVVATGKIQYVGGWDLRIGFHKPMKGYFPAGSVFSRAVSEQCIELPERK